MITVIISTLILFGCLSESVKPVRFKGPNGNIAYSMICSGWGRTMVKCYKIASAICPKGYEIIHISDFVEVAASLSSEPHPAEMSIECKELKY